MMIKFKKQSDNYSNTNYNFMSSLGYKGYFSVDKETKEIKIISTEPIFTDEEKAELLQITKNHIVNKFPDKYTYAIG